MYNSIRKERIERGTMYNSIRKERIEGGTVYTPFD